MNNIAILQKQLELHKKALNELNDSMINKLDGNDSCNDINLRKTKNNRINKRKVIESLEKYDEDDDDFDTKKLSLQSSVVTQSSNVIKSKEDLIMVQNRDSKSHQRNKRFLGVILGTLKKFKCEDTELASTEKAQHRKEIEEKIEIKKLEEKRKMIEEKQMLENEKKKNLKNIEILETKIHLTECLNQLISRYSIMKKFVRTKSKPFIFYSPKIIDKFNQNIFDENEKNLQDELDNKKSELECELKSLESQVKSCNNSSSILQNSQNVRGQIESVENDKSENLDFEMENTSEETTTRKNNKNLEDHIR